jgi:uncharacterized protein YkwD
MKYLVRSLSAALLGWSLMSLPATAGNFEQELLVQINNYREANKLKPLAGSTELDKLAHEHSRAMQKKGKASHDGFKERFKKAKAEACVENVGWNYQTPAAQFQGWENSSGHNKNMLDSDICKAGINKTGPYVTFFACK